MAKKQPKAKTTTQEVWQYEYLLQLPGEQDEMIWIPEDDERSASYKALRENSTGRLRSRSETVRSVKHQDDEVLEATEWVVKAQDLLS